MKNLFLILFNLLSIIATSQDTFEFDKIISISFSQTENKYVIDSDIDTKGKFVFNKDTTSVDFIFKGIPKKIKINKIYVNCLNSHLKFEEYDIDEYESLKLYYHNNRIYAITFNNKKLFYEYIKYIKTEW